MAFQERFHEHFTHTINFPSIIFKKTKVTKKVLDDYWRFFTDENGADVLPYAYMGSSHYYNNLIKDCSDYYLCRDEIDIISNSKDGFSKYLSGIECIMEFGPGSVHAVQNKTLHILNSAKNLKIYQGLDYSKSYLKEACDHIKSSRPDLLVQPIKANLMNLNKVKSEMGSKTRKAIMFLGSTLGNFKPDQQDYIISGFSKLANKDDILILTVDANQDKASLLKAYNNNYFISFAKEVLEYYVKINPLFKNYLNLLEARVFVDSFNTVNVFYKVKDSFSFSFGNGKIIKLSKGQELKGIISAKLTLNTIKNLVSRHSFDIINILSNESDKMKILICQKKV